MQLSELAPHAGGVLHRADHTRVRVPRGVAPAWLRALAALLDLAVTAVPALVGVAIVYSLRQGNGGGEADRAVFGTLALAVTVAFHVWNAGFSQGRHGFSVGKAWTGLIARTPDGRPLGVRGSLNPFTRRETVRRATALDEGFTELRVVVTPSMLRTRRVVGLLVLLVLLVAMVLASIAVGARPLTFAEIGGAITPPYDLNAGDAEVIIRELRLPRTVLGLVVGCALGMAGALIQGHTRNPLADPGILGVSAGSACAVVLAITLLGIGSIGGYVWFAMGGALVATVVVFGLSSVGSRTPSPVSLVLGGAAVAAFLSSFTAAAVLLDQTTLDAYRFWVVGSLAGRGTDVLVPLLPFFAVGALLALINAPGLNLLGLGEDVARALGARVALHRVAGVAGLTVLAGAATAACGPIGFVGLVVPHLARAFTGPDYRWILPYSAILGGVLITLCDVIGRVVARPGELQVGIVLALVGGPFFIAVLRRRKLVTL